MLKVKVDVKGFDQRTHRRKIKKMVKEVGLECRKRMVAATPVDSGTAKRSWSPLKDVSNRYSKYHVTYETYNSKRYAAWLEKGSKKGSRPWPSPGPRTIDSGSRIYSSQAPGGISKTAGISEELVAQIARRAFVRTFGR